MHKMPIRTVHLDQVRGRPNQATQVRKTSAIHVSPSIQHRPSDLNGYFDHLTACELEHLDRPQIVLVRTNHEQSPDQSSKLPKGVFPSGPSPQGVFPIWTESGSPIRTKPEHSLDHHTLPRVHAATELKLDCGSRPSKMHSPDPPQPLPLATMPSGPCSRA